MVDHISHEWELERHVLDTDLHAEQTLLTMMEGGTSESVDSFYLALSEVSLYSFFRWSINCQSLS